MDRFNWIPRLIGGALAALAFLIFALSTYFTIDQGERGVILHYGAIAGQSEPGLHFKMPFVTSVEKISIQPQVIAYGSKEAPVQAYSKDQQPADIQVSVNYHATDVLQVYANFGSLEQMQQRIIDPKVYEQLKNVFGQFNAVEAIQERAKFNAEVWAAIRTAVKGPVIIDSVQVQDIAFSNKYEKAVEDRMEAQVRQQQAEAAKAKRIIDADAAAYEVRAAADARAHQTEVQGTATAGAIRVRGEALRANQDIVALTTAEKWDGHLPATMPPGASVPFLNLR